MADEIKDELTDEPVDDGSPAEEPIEEEGAKEEKITPEEKARRLEQSNKDLRYQIEQERREKQEILQTVLHRPEPPKVEGNGHTEKKESELLVEQGYDSDSPEVRIARKVEAAE